MSKVLTKMEILSAQDLKQETVPVPEWSPDGVVIVREATALERDAYEESLLRPTLNKRGERAELKTDFRNSKARLVVKCIIDERGDRIFQDEDAEALGRKSAAVIDRIFQVVRRLSGMTLESKQEIEGNSDGAQNESSPSS